MKTATIPTVRIDPALRQDIEQALAAGETLASLVKTAVHIKEIKHRHQAQFVCRGLAAIDHAVALRDGLAAAAVVDRLSSKLAAARTTQAA